jgi:hypothetical protein
MTLKTLKPKVSISLTLDDEFLEYCRINDIQDIEKLARDTFRQGFTILKYGSKPSGIIMKDYIEETKKTHPDNVLESTNPVVTETPVKPVIANEKEVEKNNIYGE